MFDPVSSVIVATGSHLPERVVDNSDFAAMGLDVDDAWIRSRTGIGTRRWVKPGTSTGDLAVAAARAALERAGRPPVDLLVLATTTPDHHCPATAPWVAAELGLSGIPAFDVAAVCSGFLYAVATADAYIRSGTAETVVVIGADTISTIVDPTDRDTSVIFADGAGAVVLRAGRADEPGAVRSCRLGSDGSRFDLIITPEGGSRTPQVIEPGQAWLRMRGREVFAHAVPRMAKASRSVAEQAGWPLESVEAFIAHQANARILTAVGELLGLPEDRCHANVDRVGNTSAASIPLLMDELITNGDIAADARTVLAAFGAGMTWGAIALTWPAGLNS